MFRQMCNSNFNIADVIHLIETVFKDNFYCY